MKKSLEKDFLNKKRKGELREFNMSLKIIHQRFVQNCIKLGIGLNEYPLGYPRIGKTGAVRYLIRILLEDFGEDFPIYHITCKTRKLPKGYRKG